MKQFYRTAAAVWLAIVLVFGAAGSSVSVRAAGQADFSLRPHLLAGPVLPDTPDWTFYGDPYAYDGIGAWFGAGDVNGDGYGDVLVSAAFRRGPGGMHAGRVYLFLGSASGLSTTPAWWVEGGPECNAYYCNLGAGMAGAGDVNGDGYDDVIVGAARWNGGLYDEGRVFVYYGSPAGLGATANWSAESNQYMAYYGWAVSTAGDVNGDGYDDIIVGAGDFDHGQNNEGRTFVYLGSAAGLSCGAGCPVDATAAAAWTFESDQNNAGPGTVVGAAGDVNDDGFDDVIVGAYQFDDTLSDEGKAWVFHGSPTGLGSPAWSAVGGQAGARFGSDAYTAGDVNGDGYDDIVVGAHRYDNGQTDEGRAYLYLGSAAGLASASAWTTESDQVSADYGYGARTAGDLNGDGYADVVVAAPGFDNGQTDEGKAWVYLGSAGGLDSTAAWSAESNRAGASLGGAGVAVGAAGDVNGDGADDLVLGAPWYDLTGPYAGAAFVYYGIQANRPPDCSGATASSALLWPPNNKFVPVSIGGVTDADGDSLTLTITAIRQDEPVGTGNSAPDGKGIGAAAVELRAEKLGSGNGRVYHVSFTAGDGHGGVCTGVVRVAVPHDQAKPAVDGGPLYDSTVPTP